MWLPRLRTSTKACLNRIAQTSLPERTRSLPSRNLHLRDINLAVKALLYLFGRRTFEKQFQRFSKIIPGLFDTVPLARNIQLRTQRNITITFSFDDCGEFHEIASYRRSLHVALPIFLGRRSRGLQCQVRATCSCLSASPTGGLYAA